MRSGTTISHYQVGELLGRGGMGEVYRAVDTRLDRPVALKFLARRYVSDEAAKERFIREAKSASALDHPNICTIHDIGETAEGELYIVMALYEGATLEQRLQDETFSVERTVGILRQLANALQRAHADGIVHRDIKPANVILGDDDALRLLDFGVAKLQSADTLTQTGTTIGTAAYMSPEQGRGDEITPAADVWALGVIAYQMLAGRLPFTGSQAVVVLHKILSEDPAPLRELRPEVPPELANVVERALNKDPELRFADGGAFLRALDAVAGGDSTQVPLARPSPAKTGRPHSLLVVAAVAILAMVGFWSVTRDGSTTGGAEPLDPNAVAVLPFTVRGSPDVAYLSEGLIDLVGGRLDGAGPLRTVDPGAVVASFAGRDIAGLDQARGAERARALGAGRFVLGQLVALPGQVSLSARLHDVGATSESPLVTVEGSLDSLYVLVDELATGLLAMNLSGANARIQQSAAQSSGSLEATKAFLQGEQFHRRGQFDSASAAYNRALAFDSTFALAHLMKSMNNAYTYETDDYAAAVKADRFSGSLPERDRALARAFMDQQAGRLRDAEQQYLAHLKRYPDEVKALYQLGMIYMRANGRWGRPKDQARPLFLQVLELEPENVPALHQLARLDAGTGRYESLQGWADRLERAVPESEWAIDAATMAAFANDDQERVRELTENFQDGSLVLRLYSMYNALRFSPDPRAADRLVALQTQGDLNPDTGLPEGIAVDTDLALLVEALVDLAAGRHDKLRDFLADTERTGSPAWTAWKAELVAAGVVEVDEGTVGRLLERLRMVDPQERLQNPFEPLHDIFTPAVAALERDVNIGRLLGVLGRFDEAWEVQRRVEALPPFEAWESLREDAALGLAAYLHQLQGDDRRALEVLRAQPFLVPQTANSLSITSGSHSRFLRAELELEYGDRETARYLYAGLVESFTPPDKIFLVPAYARLGRIHEEEGRRDQAAFFYEKYLGIRGEADAALVPEREAIRARLEALADAAE